MNVTLSRDGRLKTQWVHVLVASAHLGERPAGMQVCHNNGNGCDNRVANLRWDTPQGNAADKRKHGTDGRKSHCVRGHEKSDENTYAWTNPKTGYIHRYCRKCWPRQAAAA